MTDFQPITFGKYTLLERIAVDPVGELYRASRPGENGKAQILLIKKFLPHVSQNPMLVESFSNSARISSLFKHENIAQVLDYGSVDGTFYIATAYLSGYSLHHLLKMSRDRQRPFTPEHGLHVAAQVCRALAYAHEFKDPANQDTAVIHGNLGPETVFVTYEGVVKLTDFGIHPGNIRESAPQLDQMNAWLAYMSPEQVTGDRADHRTDIFSLGILLYEMLTGRRMFQGKSMEMFSLVRHVKFEPANQVAPHLPPEMCDLIARALHKAPDDRYPSARDMLKDLERTLATRPRPSFRHGISDYFSTSQRTAAVPHAEEEETEQPHSQCEKEDRDLSESSASSSASPPQDKPERTEEKVTRGKVPSEQDPTREPAPAPPVQRRRRSMPWVIGLSASLVLVMAVGLVLHGNERWKDRTAQEVTLADAAIDACQRGDYGQAVSGFERALAARPKDRDRLSTPYARALEGLATQLLKENPTKAERLLVTARELDPRQGHIYATLGLLYLNRKDYPKAIYAYQKAVELNPGIADVFFNLGYIYAVRQEYRKAREMYSRTVELEPPFLDEALFNLALVEARLGKHEESTKNLERALKFNPDNKQVKSYLERLDT